MADIDLGEALDWLSRSLAVLVSLVGLVVAVNQLALPTILRNREKWLRTTLDAETSEVRRALLTSLLDKTTARLIGGLLVPARYYFEAVIWLFVSPFQVYLWTRTSPTLWGVAFAVMISVLALSSPIRRAIRLLAERFRVVHEYESGTSEVRRPKTGILAQMEGGTRKEFTLAALMALSINLFGAGISLLFVDLIGWAIGIGFIGVAGAVLLTGEIRKYIVARASTFGHWPEGLSSN